MLRYLILLLLPIAAGYLHVSRVYAEAEASPLPAAALPQTDVHLLFEDYYQFLVDESPALRSQLGLRGQSGWDDLSPAAQKRRQAFQQTLHQRLLAIPAGTLDATTRISHQTLLAQLEYERVQQPFVYHDYGFSQMGGWHTDVVDILINHHPVTSIADAHDYIARLQSIPALFRQWQDNIRTADRLGIRPPAFVYAPVQQSIRAILTGEPFTRGGNSPIWDDFTRKLDHLKLYPSTRALLERRARTALLQQTAPAYQQLLNLLQDMQKRAPLHQGAGNLPDGQRYYQTLLSWYSGSQTSAADVHQLGLSEVGRIHKEILQLIPALGYTGDPQDLRGLFRWMEERSPRFGNDATGRAEFLEFQRLRIRQMADRLPWFFTRLPATPLAVLAVEEYRQSNTAIAFYEPPSLNGRRPGLYYINPSRLNDLPHYRLAALAYHEALPGHHLQIALAQENEQLPAFRRILHNPAFSEGWALYAEKLAGEMGAYQSEEEEYGRLIQELWRAVRLVLDTGLHAQGWSREQATAYQLTNTPFSAAETEDAINRYLVMPGQAVAYKMGEKRLLSIRQDIEDQLGRSFDLARFHSELLSQGAMPLDVLQDHMQQWAKESR